jgi:hypothetical protein
MRYTSFYTIRELDYNTIELSLPNANISIEIKESIKRLLEDHKAMVECRKRIIKDQTCHASALFHLFEDPILENNTECNFINNNQNNSINRIYLGFVTALGRHSFMVTCI